MNIKLKKPTSGGQKTGGTQTKTSTTKKHKSKMSVCKIEYADYQWNPTWGCTKFSEGCLNCYARAIAEYRNMDFDPILKPHKLKDPLYHAKPAVIFADAMSDFFHEDFPDDYIRQIFDVMGKAPQHVYLVFTKRTERLRSLSHILPWPDNVWMGVTVENQKYVGRIDDLRATPAKVKFLSIEPLLGPMPNLDLTGIDWVIVGGEVGDDARPLNPEWVRDIRDQCSKAGVPFFFQQWGGSFREKEKNGRELDGRTHDDMPRPDNPAVKNLIVSKNLIMSK